MSDERRIKALTEQLPLLHQWRNQGHNKKRAFIVEFAGMPKAGKSSCIEQLRHFFSHGHKDIPNSDGGNYAYEVHTPAEGVSLRTPRQLKESKANFNSWAGAYALQQLLQALHDSHHDLVVLDRGPWDAGCWLEYWLKNEPGDILADEVDKVISFFQLKSWTTRSDVHVVLTVSPEVAETRESTHRLVSHGGIASKSHTMREMKQIYETRFKELIDAKIEICPEAGRHSAILIDTSAMAPREVELCVIETCFKVLSAKNNKPTLLTNESILNIIKGYLPTVRSSKREYEVSLSRITADANSLPGPKRQWFIAQLEARVAPEGIIAARAPRGKEVDPAIVDAISRLLQEAKGR